MVCLHNPISLNLCFNSNFKKGPLFARHRAWQLRPDLTIATTMTISVKLTSSMGPWSWRVEQSKLRAPVCNALPVHPAMGWGSWLCIFPLAHPFPGHSQLAQSAAVRANKPTGALPSWFTNPLADTSFIIACCGQKQSARHRRCRRAGRYARAQPIGQYDTYNRTEGQADRHARAHSAVRAKVSNFGNSTNCGSPSFQNAIILLVGLEPTTYGS